MLNLLYLSFLLFTLSTADNSFSFVPPQVSFNNEDSEPRPRVVEYYSDASDSSENCTDFSKPCKTLREDSGKDVVFIDSYKLNTSLSNIHVRGWTSIACSKAQLEVTLLDNESNLKINETGSFKNLHFKCTFPAESKPQFALIQADNSHLTIASCIFNSASGKNLIFINATNACVDIYNTQFIGTLTTETPEWNISWTDGIIQLNACNATLNSVTITNSSQGGIAISNTSRVSIDNPKFNNNNPNFKNYTSFRRNIVCSDDSIVDVRYEGTESLFLLASDKSLIIPLENNEELLSFVPTIENFTATQDDSNITITITGDLLFPSSNLFLDICAGEKRKSCAFDLQMNITNEKNVTLSFPSTELDNPTSLVISLIQTTVCHRNITLHQYKPKLTQQEEDEQQEQPQQQQEQPQQQQEQPQQQQEQQQPPQQQEQQQQPQQEQPQQQQQEEQPQQEPPEETPQQVPEAQSPTEQQPAPQTTSEAETGGYGRIIWLLVLLLILLCLGVLMFLSWKKGRDSGRGFLSAFDFLPFLRSSSSSVSSVSSVSSSSSVNAHGIPGVHLSDLPSE